LQKKSKTQTNQKTLGEISDKILTGVTGLINKWAVATFSPFLSSDFPLSKYPLPN
jgi:hypothetical protein